MPRIFPALLLTAVAGLAGCAPEAPAGRGAPELLVAAASDLSAAFEEIGRLYEAETGTRVTFSFGSTGMLTQQIENGAPVDLFAAANVGYIDRLAARGLIFPDTKAVYARGRIALWTRRDSPLRVERLEDLARPEVRRVSLANPEHAPYGLAARQALEAAGLWAALGPKLVYGENVRQAQQFAETGNADAAITALSLSIQSEGRWTRVPDELYEPIRQALAVIRTTPREAEARRFAAFLNGDAAREVLQRYGFEN